VAEGDLPEAVADPERADQAVLRADRLKAARAAVAGLDAMMSAMDAEDQIILRMRFWSARKVPEIASALRIDQKRLYKRIESLLSALRTQLRRAGIDSGDVEELIAHGDQEIAFGATIWEKGEKGRSHSSDEKVQMKSDADGTGDAAL
jgi:hypothetical protein